MSTEKELQFAQLLNAVQKKVTVKLSNEAIAKLKEKNYKLCFAKKVNDEYNVIWQAYSEYLNNTKLSWTPMYQIFCQNEYIAGNTVVVDTDPVNITLGQKAIFDELGVLKNAGSGEDQTSITLVNNSTSDLHPGINQLTNGSAIPIYVAKKGIIKGEDKLTPKESILIWFEQNVETSTMKSISTSDKKEIDFTDMNSAAVEYDYKTQKWNDLPSNE